MGVLKKNKKKKNSHFGGSTVVKSLRLASSVLELIHENVIKMYVNVQL